MPRSLQKRTAGTSPHGYERLDNRAEKARSTKPLTDKTQVELDKHRGELVDADGIDTDTRALPEPLRVLKVITGPSGSFLCGYAAAHYFAISEKFTRQVVVYMLRRISDGED